MGKRVGAVTLAVVLLESLLPTASVGESLYVISGRHLVRSNLEGSGAEVVTDIANPHCRFNDLDIHASGVVYVVIRCTTPIENLLARLGPDLKWEELLRFSSAGDLLSCVELSHWAIFEVLYYANLGDIHLMSLDDRFPFDMVLYSTREVITGLDVDSTNDKIYWAQGPRDPMAGGGSIMRAGRFSPNDSVETLVTGVAADDVSVDEANGRVYWSNAAAGTIQRANAADGQNVEIVLEGLTIPTGIAIHAASQKLYWAEVNGIRRSNLEGSMVEDILSLPDSYRIRFGPDGFVAVDKSTWGGMKGLYR